MAALSLDSIRNQIRDSIKGRKLGLDTNNDPNTTYGGSSMRGGFLAGYIGSRLPVQFVGSTVASTLYPTGYIELASAPSTQSFNAPIPGAEVTITYTGTSTGGYPVRLTNGNFNSSTGSSNNQLTLWGQGASVRLVGLSTALFGVISGLGQTTAQVSYSTF